jgi:hypothetical protein
MDTHANWVGNVLDIDQNEDNPSEWALMSFDNISGWSSRMMQSESIENVQDQERRGMDSFAKILAWNVVNQFWNRWM